MSFIIVSFLITSYNLSIIVDVFFAKTKKFSQNLFAGNYAIQNHPKTEQSVRKIYLAQNTVEILKRLKTDSINSNMLRGTNTDLVLPNEHGNIYHTSALRSRWIKVCAELEIPYKNLHALRHTYATIAIKKGVEVHTLSKMLGHKSIATTLDIYKSVFSDQKIEAAKILNDVL